ncbi:hypothetical protein [Clostridium neonatale]|nr:hypothetical protein [Clostridium neonatale]
MKNNYKSNRIYFGYSFDNIKNRLKYNLSLSNSKMKDYGGVIKIEYREYSVFIDSILSLSIIGCTDIVDEESLNSNINSIQSIIKKEISGFEFVNN